MDVLHNGATVKWAPGLRSETLHPERYRHGEYIPQISNGKRGTSGTKWSGEGLKSLGLAYRPRGISITSLPTELLSLIFIYCLPDNLSIPPHPSVPPLVLCRICRSWRAVARSTPRVWATIPMLSTCTPFDPGAIQSWIGLSADYPMTVGLIDGVNYRTQTVELMIDLLSPHCRRWETAVLRLCSKNLLKLSNAIQSSGGLSTLRNLRVHNSDSYDQNEDNWLIELDISSGEKLVNVWASGNVLLTPSPSARSFPNIRHVTFDSVLTTEPYLDFVMLCPLIETFRLFSGVPGIGQVQILPESNLALKGTYTRTVFPFLHTLQLDLTADPRPFMDAITVPSLRDLFVEITLTREIGMRRCTEGLLRRSVGDFEAGATFDDRVADRCFSSTTTYNSHLQRIIWKGVANGGLRRHSVVLP